MNPLRKTLMAAASLVGAVAVLASGSFAEAQTQQLPRISNLRTFGNVNKLPGSAQAFSTTSYAALTGLSVVNTTVNDPSEAPFQNASTYITEHLHIWWTADVSKVTSTGGTCALYLNGTIITASVRTFTPAAWPTEGAMSGFYDAYYANGDQFNVGVAGETQTVALYCKSGDTAAFTVNQATLFITEVF